MTSAAPPPPPSPSTSGDAPPSSPSRPPRLARLIELCAGLGRGVHHRRRRLAWFAGGVGVAALLVQHPPVATVTPGALTVRTNLWTGALSTERAGWMVVVPGVHTVETFPLLDQTYRPSGSASATGAAPYQSLEGLSFGLDLSIRYALDVTRVGQLPVPADQVGRALVEPQIDGVVRRIFATHTVREIFSSQRLVVEDQITRALTPLLARDGVLLKAVFVGNVDLPAEYRQGLESLLAEELASEKMRYTLELKEKAIKESALEGEAEKVRQEKAAEAAGQTEIIAAKARAEAMRHVLPFKEKEIEQRRLEAEAGKVARIKAAEGNAEARRIEASGEADSRRTLAASDAYRAEVMAKAASDAMARDSVLLAQNPLLIQKAVADKLSDKISVVIAPPEAGGFFAANLLGKPAAPVVLSARGEGE